MDTLQEQIGQQLTELPTPDIDSTTQKVLNDISTGKFWDQLLYKGADALITIGLALLLFFIGSKIIKFLLKAIRKAMNRHNIEEGVSMFLISLFKYAFFITLIVVELGIFGIKATTISAAVASMLVTVGLALQGALSNFAGGVLILINHPFKVGDYIIEDTHKNEGTVEHISIIYTTLASIDGKTIVIPNGALANSSLTNITSRGMRMINETVGISYDSDIKRAKEIMQEIAESVDCRIPNEQIQIFVSELGESSVNLGVRFWVITESYWKTKWDMLEEIKSRFDEEGINICFNQLDVFIKNK